MSDERPESLAAQMGVWVPPWERTRDEPGREFQAAVTAEADDQADDEVDDEPEAALAPVSPAAPDPIPADEPARTEAEAIGYLAGYRDTDAQLTGTGVAPAEPTGEDLPVEPAGEDFPVDSVGEDAPVEPAEEDVADVTVEAVPEKLSAPAVPAQPTGPRRPAPAPADAEPAERVMDGAELAAALEAILLVVDEPTSELKLAEILEQPVELVARTLDDISARYTAAGHGFDLRRAAGGWRLYTRPEYAAYVERFVLDGQSTRLTQAALETLAVVAYKQPVTRSRISAIRGVNCDGVMRTLVTRGLIEECGTEPETGAYLYRTTGLFLEKLGLNSVDQLPPLAPFLPDDVEEVLDASG
ncbi:SMC-Scp complex subunit ScpB [Actinoplanes regularis]|uniref:SMC-Scp complex subunit ScpB n=1 Tax=Actinoplanes regularis TaxID=52697 RepID=UPI00249FE9A6|nr:SMC-Scp complex subunit ScpB [Actinoplanes regularis]GLW33273.1 hypothetical protein Areg01_62110 [Actinoplanes regularis]